MQGKNVKVFSIGLGDNVDKAQIQGVVNNQKDFFMIEPIAHFPLALMSLQLMALRRKFDGSSLKPVKKLSIKY